MKKNFILGMTIASTLLVACSNDDIVDVNIGNAITFRTLIDAPTRSNQETTNSLATFNVTAIKNEGIEFATTVTKSSSTWNTMGTYYWPNYELKFYAYANGPASGKGTVTITEQTKTITGFTPAANVTEQKDLLVAYNSGTKENYNNASIPLNFKHALSQIEVKAKNLKSSSVKIEIIGVKLVNMATKGDLTFPETVLDETNKLPLANWSNQTESNIPSKAYYSNGTQAVVLNSTEFQSIMFGDNNFMVIPQQLTAWDKKSKDKGAYLAVLCRISNLSDAGETLIYPAPTAGDNKDGKYAYSAVAIDTKWEPGKKYVYNLTFCSDGGGAGKIDPNPENPGGGTNTETNPGTSGEDILGGPITFNVTVDNWEEMEVPTTM